MTEETLFADALKQPTSEARRAWLEQTCADNPELRRRLEALLRGHDDAGSFLAAAAAVEAAQLDAGAGAEAADAAAGARNTPVNEPTQAESHASAGSDLAFLGPSTTPGSLGRLAHYEVLQILGRGGFGVVLKARDTVLERVVAIKVMSGPTVSTGAARKRFIREAQAAAAVIHDNVVTIHEVKSDDVPYLVMQYIHGQTLQDKLDRAGPIELKEILRIGTQIASGLAAAHAQGLVHRDIKPANILLENGVERVKITDFGLARLVDDASVTQSGVIAGTPQYMSPEQAQGEPVDHRTDLFSLGSVLYALCAGHPPFRASGSMAVLKRVIEDTPRPVRDSNPDIPDWLETIIAKLHAKPREDRFQSAAEAAQVLGQHLAHVQQPHLAPRPEPVQAPAPARSAVQAAPAPETPWSTALLILYAVPGVFFALLLVLLGYYGSTGDLLANWPAAMAVGLLAIAALVLALVARRAASRNARQVGHRATADLSKRRIIKTALLAALAALLLWFFGRSWWHFATNISRLRLSANAAGIEKLVVRQNGAEVRAVDGPGYAQFNLQPGTYELEAVCQTGHMVAEVGVRRFHLFITEGFQQAMPNQRMSLHLKRGEQVELTFNVVAAPQLPPVVPVPMPTPPTPP
jgi:predicted Ser/Thr protein kinase